jgi:acyl-CoA thioesterase-1
MPLRYWLSLLILLVVSMTPAHSADSDERFTLLVLGDSLTAGYGLDQADAFPARLEVALAERGHEVRVMNAGVSGDTSAGGLRRLGWALADNPDLVMIELGANDALRGLDPEQTRDNLARIITTLKQKNIKILLAGMQAPRNLGAAYTTHFDRIYPELAEEFAIPLYPFFLEGVATDPFLNQADGIHPNRFGVDVIVSKIIPTLEPLLP